VGLTVRFNLQYAVRSLTLVRDRQGNAMTCESVNKWWSSHWWIDFNRQWSINWRRQVGDGDIASSSGGTLGDSSII
jgi:hypothetical protein